MPAIVGLRCLRCGSHYHERHYAQDCPKCHTQAPSNLVVEYEASVLAPRPRPTAQTSHALWRYGDLLPVGEHEAVTFGEGATPLLRLAATGRSVGVGALFGKEESRTPTGSFKDRLACIAVSMARKMGAPAVVSSSTGNAGAAVAAYAARAQLPCIVFTAKGVAGPLSTQMRAYGATVIAAANKADRWPLMQHGVREFGWFPTSPFFAPVVGSNPYGIEGYKTLAYEIAEQMNWEVPDCCVLPVCYGDALIGMWRGFLEMRALGWIERLPRMLAAEIYGSLSAALRAGGDALPDMPLTHETVAKSTAATRSTFQALHALRKSGGTATVVRNDSILEWQRRLAREEGVYVEPASAGTLAAIAQLRASGEIKERDTVVALLTASGLKDPDATASVQGELLSVSGDPPAVFAQLAAAKLIPV